MNTLEEIPSAKIAKLCEESYIERMYVVGSFARGRQRPDSDVDFLIERTNEKKNLKVMHAFAAKLSKLVDRDVDVVTTSILENRVFKQEFEQHGKLVYSRG
ncbi:MAG: hypothetical protein COC22_00260 [Flavobacteriaceae bacterium]|nr:MAG: hypothetical protein COC22_00260 [Flavobacteriaceae bacterium]